MSSLFPLLRSLLSSPPSSLNDPRRAVIHQTIKDRDRGGFTTPDRPQHHLSYTDTGLRGAQGAAIVLDALATNPFAHKLTLSHNALGDPGVRQLATRVRFLRTRRAVDIRELSLASNALTDAAFAELLRHWPGLAELYLSNNLIQLAHTPSPMLELGALSLLSLTSNPIDCCALASLFRNPAFAPAELSTLHLSACALDAPVAFALAAWLEDGQRSGRLEWLAVNGNNWGLPGCERIVWALARKDGNKNLLRLEMLACDLVAPTPNDPQSGLIDLTRADSELSPDERAVALGFLDAADLEDCRAATDAAGGWKALLDKCEARNQVLRLAARRAALGLVGTARTVLLSAPAPEKTEGPATFPWTRLPEELQHHVWRWVALLSAFPGLEHQPVGFGRPAESSTTLHRAHMETTAGQRSKAAEPITIPDPLTAMQLGRLLKYAQDRETLAEQIGQQMQFLQDHRADSDHLGSFHRQLVEAKKISDEADRIAQELVLKSAGCQRFEGTI